MTLVIEEKCNRPINGTMSDRRKSSVRWAETAVIVGMRVQVMLMCFGLSQTFPSHELEQQALE